MTSPRIISMEFSTIGRDDCYFRILAGNSVKYITIQAGALDGDSLMNMPLEFQDILPVLPYSETHWNTAYISRNLSSGRLGAVVSKKELKGVRRVWHPEMFNFLDIERTEQLTLLAQECSWVKENAKEPRVQTTMIAKMARFHWEIQYIEAETHIYQLLESTGIAPRFLGHIHEEGRVMGLLLEKVEGRCAGISDLKSCEKILGRLHSLGILHGDANRHNFIISPNGEALLIDFEKSRANVDAKSLAEEMEGLRGSLSEETGLGGGFCSLTEQDN